MKTKTILSVLMASLYSASATEVRQMSALKVKTDMASASSVSATGEQEQVRKRVYDARRAGVDSVLAAKKKIAADVWRANRAKHWQTYIQHYNAFVLVCRERIEKLPQAEQGAAWRATYPEFAAKKLKYYTNPMKEEDQRWFATVRPLQAAAAEQKAELTKAEQADNRPYTLPKKVQNTCDGGLQRLYNEQTAHLFEIAEASPGKYTDISFPADREQLVWKDQWHYKKDFKAMVENMPLYWERVSNQNKRSDIWGKNGISPAGIRQGMLGDCWWLAIVSGLAEHPQRIKKLFKNMDIEKGLYELEMFSNGVPTSVVIDDYLLQETPEKTGPMMAKVSKGGAWWVPLLEKASAKFYANYLNMYGGHAGQAWAQLTGYPFTWIWHNKHTDAELLDIFNTADDNHNVIYVAMSKGADQGIVLGHAYPMLSTMKWDGIDFVQLRNTWGWREWQGKWSDYDKTTDSKKLAAFRAHVKEKYGHTKEEDGKFWMAYKDLHPLLGPSSVIGTYLDDYQTTLVESEMYHKEWTNDQGQKQKKHFYFTMKNPVKQHVYLKYNMNENLQFRDQKCYDPKKMRSFEKGWTPRTLLARVGLNTTPPNRQWTDQKWAEQHHEWKEMPAGDYMIEINPILSGYKPEVPAPFSLQAFASSQKITIAKDSRDYF